MRNCYWCGKKEELYAFNLCHSCYRWFWRHKDTQPEYCSLCGKYITKRQKGTCKACRSAIKSITSTPKRITHLEEKYANVSDILISYTSAELATSALLNTIFKPKQQHLLKIVCDRFFDHRTLQDIATELKVSREYVRQCEDKGIQILEKA